MAKVPDFPDRGSVEYIDDLGNHRLISWYPITYYAYEDKVLGGTIKDVPLPNSGDKHPSTMAQLFSWLKGQTQKAKEVISSTTDEIVVTKKEKDDSSKRGKPKRKRKNRK